MNVVLDEATEVTSKKATRRDIGRIVIKGDNISLICNITEWLIKTTDEIKKGTQKKLEQYMFQWQKINMQVWGLSQTNA